jgi:hypothetical protein
MGFTLRRATSSDADAIANVYHTLFRLLTFLPMLHTIEEYQWFISNVTLKECEVTVAEDESGIVAFLARRGEEVRLLYTRPDRIGMGAGTHLIDAAKASEIGALELWCSAISTALKFSSKAIRAPCCKLLFVAAVVPGRENGASFSCQVWTSTCSPIPSPVPIYWLQAEASAGSATSRHLLANWTLSKCFNPALLSLIRVPSRTVGSERDKKEQWIKSAGAVPASGDAVAESLEQVAFRGADAGQAQRHRSLVSDCV